MEWTHQQKKELLAANKSNNEICKYIEAKSLKFLSIDGLYNAMGFESRNNNYPQLTDHPILLVIIL